MLKTRSVFVAFTGSAYHLGEGRMLKTGAFRHGRGRLAYHLGEGRMLKT